MKVNHERQKEQESPVKQTEKAKESILQSHTLLPFSLSPSFYIEQIAQSQK